MLADPRAKNFVDGFAHQWLDMERLDFFQFDVAHHREFDDNAKKAAREEVYQTILHLIKNNGRLGDLLSSDYLVVDGLMANHYGIDGVYGQNFAKSNYLLLPRGGLLGMAAINAMGSNGLETSQWNAVPGFCVTSSISHRRRPGQRATDFALRRKSIDHS